MALLHRCALLSAVVLLLGGCAAKLPAPGSPDSPQAAATPAPQLSSAVARINYYRAVANLPRLTIATRLDDGAAKHARYVFENHLEPVDFTYADGRLKQFKPGKDVHEENPENPWYTPAGAEAAKACRVFETSSLPLDGGVIIDQFMTTPFMAIATLDPSQSAVGYGQYCSSGRCVVVASLWIWWPGLNWDTYFTEDDSIQRVKLSDGDIERMWLKTPRQFPPAGSNLPAKPLGNFGYLNPLTACPGYTYPAGGPIILSIGWARDMKAAVMLTAHSLLEDGRPLESCAFDATSYVNPDPDQQKLFKEELLHTLSAVMIPRKPLEPGHTYDVSMTLNSKVYSWSFKTAPEEAAK